MHAPVRDVAAAEALFGGHERLRRRPPRPARPGAARGARRRPPPRGALQPRRREQRRRVVRRSARDLGDERARRRAAPRRGAPRQPRDALLPGVVGRDVRLDARRRRRARRDVGAQPAEPVRRREGRGPPALPQLSRVVRRADRLRDPLQPRVPPPRRRGSSRARSSTTCRRSVEARRTRVRSTLGNLKAQRDWGFAPDYVDGHGDDPAPDGRARRPRRRRSPTATTCSAPGELHARLGADRPRVRARRLRARLELDGHDPLRWRATFADTGEPAVVVDPAFVRPADPRAIARRPVPDPQPSSAGSRSSGSTVFLARHARRARAPV